MRNLVLVTIFVLTVHRNCFFNRSRMTQFMSSDSLFRFWVFQFSKKSFCDLSRKQTQLIDAENSISLINCVRLNSISSLWCFLVFIYLTFSFNFKFPIAHQHQWQRFCVSILRLIFYVLIFPIKWLISDWCGVSFACIMPRKWKMMRETKVIELNVWKKNKNKLMKIQRNKILKFWVSRRMHMFCGKKQIKLLGNAANLINSRWMPPLFFDGGSYFYTKIPHSTTSLNYMIVKTAKAETCCLSTGSRWRWWKWEVISHFLSLGWCTLPRANVQIVRKSSVFAVVIANLSLKLPSESKTQVILQTITHGRSI